MINTAVKNAETFNRRYNLDLHCRTINGSTPYANEGSVCHLKFNRRDHYNRHRKLHGAENGSDLQDENCMVISPSLERKSTDVLTDHDTRQNQQNINEKKTLQKTK